MNNVCKFWGTDHKVGTTMLAQSCAEILATSGSKRVLLLTLSENSGDDFSCEGCKSIEDLRHRLACNLLTKENILEYINKSGEIYKINGLANPKNMFSFSTEMTIGLIDIAARAFDEVIVDSGTGLSSPLTLAALTYNRNNVVVFSQQASSLRCWNVLRDKMTEHGILLALTIINKFIKGDHITPSYIAQRTGIMQNTFKTVAESEYGIQAEADRKTLLYFGEKQIEKDLTNIVQWISGK